MVLSDSENSYSYREAHGNAKFTQAQTQIAIEIYLWGLAQAVDLLVPGIANDVTLG